MKKYLILLVLLVLLVLAVLFRGPIGEWFLALTSPGGPPKVEIRKDNGYQLVVNGKPYLVKGFCYEPIPIGKDYEYNYWGDPNKPWLSDGRMMKEAGANTVRFYRAGKNPAEVRKVLEDLYRRFRIRALMGHYLGFWDWPPPNYTDPRFRDKVRTEVLEMVRLYKDSPGVLMWVLGNENNYSFDQNVQRWSSDEIDQLPTADAQRREKAKIYYTFVNELAKDVKKIDPNRPVVLGVGETKSLDIASQYCPDIDLIGMIAYRGPGFGSLFREVKQRFDLPVVMIEWGADSFNAVTKEPDELQQAEFISSQWKDIARNADPAKGVGNCVGGTLFEWNDEWWKNNPNVPHTWFVHDSAANWGNASYYFDWEVAGHQNMNEEWWGAVSLSPRKSRKGTDTREPKQSYDVLREHWTGKTAS